MVSRYKQREIVLQALYMYEVHNKSISLDELLKFEWVKFEASELEYSTLLLSTVFEHLDTIDATFSCLLVRGKTIYNVLIIDMSILRLAIAEINFLELESKVVISEAVMLANKYSIDNSYKFINGILDSVMQKNQKLKINIANKV